MDVVYLFYENGNIRIPFYNYDKNLFSKLVGKRIGFWDHSQSQYIVKSEYADTLINDVLAGKPYVEVEKHPETPIIVGGFLNQPQALDFLNDAAAVPLQTLRTDDKASAVRRPLPDMFSPSWQAKLEADY
jgi:hypothetical protein